MGVLDTHNIIIYFCGNAYCVTCPSGHVGSLIRFLAHNNGLYQLLLIYSVQIFILFKQECKFNIY